jgi:hypothetical protein
MGIGAITALLAISRVSFGSRLGQHQTIPIFRENFPLERSRFQCISVSEFLLDVCCNSDCIDDSHTTTGTLEPGI